MGRAFFFFSSMIAKVNFKSRGQGNDKLPSQMILI